MEKDMMATIKASWKVGPMNREDSTDTGGGLRWEGEEKEDEVRYKQYKT